jgi:hypothetical protein
VAVLSVEESTNVVEALTRSTLLRDLALPTSFPPPIHGSLEALTEPSILRDAQLTPPNPILAKFGDINDHVSEPAVLERQPTLAR